MKFGFSLVVRGGDATPQTFMRMAERAEALELDSLWCSGHIIVPPQVKSDYAMVPGLKFPPTWKENYWEPFTVLSYLAAVTSNIQLGTSVVVLPMHNPFEIAKQVAEVDQLSQGRFVFGVGVGWFAEEFEILGQDFNNRGVRTDEALELMKALWRDETVNFRGSHYAVENAAFTPKPVQQPAPPIWVAGASKAAMRRAARYGDAWHPSRPSLPNLRQARKTIDGYLEQEGREPDSLEIAVKLPLVFQDRPPGSEQASTEGRVADIIDGIQRYRELGVSHFVFDFVPETLANALQTMEQFVEDVRPKL